MSSDGRSIVSGSYDGTVRVWDAVTGDLLRTCAAFDVSLRNISISQDGKHIMAVSFSDTACVWDAHSGKVRMKFDAERPGLAIYLFDCVHDEPRQSARGCSTIRWHPAHQKNDDRCRESAWRTWRVFICLLGESGRTSARVRSTRRNAISLGFEQGHAYVQAERL